MALGRIGSAVLGYMKRYGKRPVVARAGRRARRETKLFTGGIEAGVYGDKTRKTQARLSRSRPFKSGYTYGKRGRRATGVFGSAYAAKTFTKAIRAWAVKHPFTTGAAGGAAGGFAARPKRRRRR